MFRSLIDACLGPRIHANGAIVQVPGTLPIRLSVVAGNLRVHRLVAGSLRPGGTFVDVGAHVGYNTMHAASLVGRSGRVIAIEPAPDNLAVLRANVDANGYTNVRVEAVAAGAASERRPLFLRGDQSAVNSLYPESFYAPVTATTAVDVRALDDVVEGTADVVKIDVEGGEVQVLAGMVRLLGNERIRLVVEWHPVLQIAAGQTATALPERLIQHGFDLIAATHTRTMRLAAKDLPHMAARLERSRRPVELFAWR